MQGRVLRRTNTSLETFRQFPHAGASFLADAQPEPGCSGVGQFICDPTVPLAQPSFWIQLPPSKSPDMGKDSTYLGSILGGAGKSPKGLGPSAKTPAGPAKKAGESLLDPEVCGILWPFSGTDSCESGCVTCECVWSVICVTPGHGMPRKGG